MAYTIHLIEVLLVTIAFSTVHPLEYHLEEESPADTVIGSIISDSHLTQSYGDNIANLRFNILGSDETSMSTYFTIGEVNSILTVAQPVDRETMCGFKRDCTVVLDIGIGPAQYFKVITVKIFITDINDNEPKFADNEFQLFIPENSQPGTSFNLPPAEDLDIGNNSVQRYIIEAPVNGFALEMIKSWGGSHSLQLVVRGPLDREKSGSFRLRVKAMDGGKPPKFGILMVNVTIGDVNDNSPSFENEKYEVELFENATVRTLVVSVHATDLDAGQNGAIIYGFDMQTANRFGSIFSIDSNTGTIVVTRELDYEKVRDYHLKVTARDMGTTSRVAYCSVFVHILDVNDNAPHIKVNTLTSDSQPQVLEESPIGTFVAHMSVTDKDSGQNAQVLCSLNDYKFRLESIKINQYKIVTSMVLDRESNDKYKVMITCRDRGVVPMTSNKEVEILVSDINDNAPVFDRSEYESHIVENNPVGEIILNLVATDLDTGDNARIQYSLINDSHGMFNIDANTGLLEANCVFDYESEHDVYVSVEARDLGKPPKCSTATVHLIILDANDQAPAFTLSSYTFVVLENQPRDTEVGKVLAFDADTAPYSHLRYSILSKDVEGIETKHFTINPKTGQISTGRVLDRENKSVYHLIAVATNTDRAALRGTANITLYVSDENDNTPVISHPDGSNNTVYLSNALPLGNVLTRIYASDADIGINGRLRYYIIQGNDDNLFDIDGSSGAVLVASDLTHIDYEIFNLTICVRDQSVESPRNSCVIVNLVVNKLLAAPPGSGMLGGVILSGGNMTVVIIMAAVSGVIIALLIAAIVLMVFRNHVAKATADCHRYAGGDDNTHDYDPSSVYVGTIDSTPFSINLGDEATDRRVPNTEKKIMTRPGQLTGNGLLPSISNGSLSAHTNQMKRAESKGEVDSDSGCSGDISTADSGRGTIEETDNVTVSSNRQPWSPLAGNNKAKIQVHQSPLRQNSKVPLNNGLTNHHMKYPPTNDFSYHNSEPSLHSNQKQTMRDIKAKDRAKRLDIPLMSTSDASLSSASQLKKTGNGQRVRFSESNNFKDADSLMNYKLEGSRNSFNSEPTDDTSTTSGSYVLNNEDLESSQSDVRQPGIIV